jgi:O-antigen ligase
MLETFVVVMATLVFIFVVGLNNNFFSRIWNYWTNDKAVVFSNYFDYLGFGARFIYGETAYRIYENNPLFGVGLGNYAFYFEDNMPDRLLAETPEVLHILTQNANRYRLITPKNLYLRILAETGLLGFSAFLVFIVAIIGCALYLRFSPDDEQRFWGTSGLLVLISFFVVAMSFDSFTFPDMWVVFGITTSAAWMFNKIPESMIAEELKVISRV